MSYQFKPDHFYHGYQDSHNELTLKALYELIMNTRFRWDDIDSVPGEKIDKIQPSQIEGTLAPNQVRIGVGTVYDHPDFNPANKETPEGAQNKANDALDAAKKYRDEWKHADFDEIDSVKIYRSQTSVNKRRLVELQDGRFATVSTNDDLKTMVEDADALLVDSILDLVPKKWVDDATGETQYGLLTQELQNAQLDDFIGDPASLLVMLIPLIKQMKERIEDLENMLE